MKLALSPLSSAAQARAADAWTMGVVGVPGLVLMEHAGRGVADIVASRLKDHGRVLLVCGRGNNGGDGLVCARHLAGRGVPVSVLLPQEPTAGDALLALQLLRAAVQHKGLPVSFVVDVEAALAEGPAVVVDALFGTGLSRALDMPSLALVAAMARARAKGALVIAVDLPSGLPTDGQATKERAAGDTVVADITVTFGGLKIAHRAEPGCVSCGEVVNVDIGLLHPAANPHVVFGLDGVRLRAPGLLVHKGSFGHVAVVEGSPPLRGAAHLAARAALRTGAGRVSLMGEGSGRLPEIMATTVHEGAGVDVVVAGPGLLPELVPVDALLELRHRFKLKIVADAGALGVLVKGQAQVWTPHAGEAGRVLGCSSADVQADRLAAACALVDHLGGVVVLKGAQPVVASAHRCVIVEGRAPALAVAGSGDVLAGVIAAVVAGALGPCCVEDAVVAAVWLHQQAGRSLNRGALASEIADAIAPIAHGAIEATGA